MPVIVLKNLEVLHKVKNVGSQKDYPIKSSNHHKMFYACQSAESGHNIHMKHKERGGGVTNKQIQEDLHCTLVPIE